MEKLVKHKNYSIWAPLLVALAAAIGMVAGYNMNQQNIGSSMIEIDIPKVDSGLKDGRIEEIIRFIETNYVDSIDENLITIDAIRHIMKQLDPHSDYITAEELNAHNERMEGEYRGIGIETVKLRDTFFVSKIIKGGPAENAGLSIGDALLQVGKDTISGNNVSYNYLRERLKSKKAKTLKLKKLSLDDKITVVENIKIDNIPLPSADLSYLLDDYTAYIKLVRFSSNTYEQFIESIDEAIKDKEYINLVLDLRENPGGFLPQAIKVLSQLFNERDKLLTYTEGLSRKKSEYRSTGKAFYNIKKVAILINDYSASGSEIVAGCIQDWDRGVVIGTPSYGKGLVQEIFPLKNGGALRLTVAKYFTPSGRLIQKSYHSISKDFIADSTEYNTRLLNRKVNSGRGIEPDILIEDDQDISCYAYENYIDFFIMDKMLEQKNSEFNPITMVEDELINFIVDEYGENIDLIKSDCDRDMNEAIFARYLRMTEGDIPYKKYINKTDPFVAEALRIVGSKKTTLALLAEK